MDLLLLLLIAVGWLGTAIVIPQEAFTSGKAIGGSPKAALNIGAPTYSLQPLSEYTRNIPSCRTDIHGSDTLIDDAAHNGMETASSGPTGSEPARFEKRTNRGGSPGDYDACRITKVKVPSRNGYAWVYSDHDNSLVDCYNYCATHSTKPPTDIKSQNCFKNDNIPWFTNPEMTIEPSDDAPFGTEIQSDGHCVCDWKFLDDMVGDMITKALPVVGEITCKVFYTAISTVLTIGIAMIPVAGPVEATAVSVASQAATIMAWTFTDPDEALKHYTEWLQNRSGGDSESTEGMEKSSTGLMDAICGNKYTTTEAEDIFNKIQFTADFASAPKLFIGSTRGWPPPFPRGGGNLQVALDFIRSLIITPKSHGGNDKPDPNKPDPDKPDPDKPDPIKPDPTQPKITDQSTATAPHKTTNKPQSSSHTSDDHPKCKRADDSCPGAVTIYSVGKMIPKEEVIPKTCNHEAYPQACAHCYSAIRAGEMPSKFTCSASHNGRAGTATKHWTAQHKKNQWQSFTQSATDRKGRVREPNCEADEFPPAYFMPNNDQPQLIRWIPSFDNSGAANSLWKGFCKKYDGDIGNGQRVKPRKGVAVENKPTEQKDFDRFLLQLEGPRVLSHVDKKKGTTTTSIWEKATFTRAVFSLAFSYGENEAPSRKNQWHLDINPCWPKAIVPNDPGYVILADDTWYDNHVGFPDARNKRGRYINDPTQQETKDAQKAQAKINKPGRRTSPDEPPSANVSIPNALPLRRAEKLELHEGRIIARDIETNASRPLTEDEIRHQVEIVSCKDKKCSAELQGRDMDEKDLLIPAVPPPSLPSINRNAVPTFAPTNSMRTETRPQERTKVFPDMPVVTR